MVESSLVVVLLHLNIFFIQLISCCFIFQVISAKTSSHYSKKRHWKKSWYWAQGLSTDNRLRGEVRANFSQNNPHSFNSRTLREHQSSRRLRRVCRGVWALFILPLYLGRIHPLVKVIPLFHLRHFYYAF